MLCISYPTLVVATTSLRMINKLLSKLKGKVSHRDHKRTQQEVPNAFLHYLYKYTWPVLMINNPILISIHHL